MRIMRKPCVNAAIISIISFIYSSIFILTSDHIEFERILGHEQTLNNDFWNEWSAFLRQGNLKYVGYIYLIIVICIIALSILQKRNYDEYQVGILTTSFIVTGLLLLFLFPVAFLLVLSDPNYAVETILFLIVIHWSIFLIVALVYSIKWLK